jgi:hypothetical protein
MKFGLDWKVKFKKSFELYEQISVRVLTKVVVNFVHVCEAWMKVSKMQQIFKEISMPVKQNLAKYFWSYTELDEKLWYWAKFHKS